MSPRGVAVPEAREQLFRAAQRVLDRDGPSGLSSRAITREAGLAKGLLHNHFADLDEFLAEFVIDRSRLATRSVAGLSLRVGEGTVVGNLTDVALSLLESDALALVSLVMSRPALLTRVRAALTVDAAEFHQLETAFAAYLHEEEKLGRVAAHADTEALALALVGALHYLVLIHGVDEANLRQRVHDIVAALAAGF